MIDVPKYIASIVRMYECVGVLCIMCDKHICLLSTTTLKNEGYISYTLFGARKWYFQKRSSKYVSKYEKIDK